MRWEAYLVLCALRATLVLTLGHRWSPLTALRWCVRRHWECWRAERAWRRGVA